MNHRLCLFVLLLAACGKDAPQPELKAKAAAAIPKPAPEKKLPPTPQGKLPQMDPAKAKFIAVPSTPGDSEMKKPAPEIKKAAAPAVETKKAEQPAPEIKKAAPAQQ